MLKDSGGLARRVANARTGQTPAARVMFRLRESELVVHSGK
jgi:hypothetical protein